MITRAYRIPRTLFPHNKRPTFVGHSSLFRISLYKDSALSHVRIAVVIGKKEISSAVERNSLRRRVYRGLIPYVDELHGFYVIITPRKEAKKAKLKEIVNHLRETLSQVFPKNT